MRVVMSQYEYFEKFKTLRAENAALRAFVQKQHDETNCICQFQKYGVELECTKCEAAKLLGIKRAAALSAPAPEGGEDEHKTRHLELHKALDELVADWIMHTTALPSKNTVLDLIQWSHTQTIEPTEGVKFSRRAPAEKEGGR